MSPAARSDVTVCPQTAYWERSDRSAVLCFTEVSNEPAASTSYGNEGSTFSEMYQTARRHCHPHSPTITQSRRRILVHCHPHSPTITQSHGWFLVHCHPHSPTLTHTYTVSQTDSCSFNRRRFGRSAVTQPRPLLSAEIQTDSPKRRPQTCLIWNEAELRQRRKECVEPRGDVKCPKR